MSGRYVAGVFPFSAVGNKLPAHGRPTPKTQPSPVSALNVEFRLRFRSPFQNSGGIHLNFFIAEADSRPAAGSMLNRSVPWVTGRVSFETGCCRGPSS